MGYHSQSSVRYKFYNFVDFICCFIMLERPGDLIPVTPQATSIPWTKRRSQILKFLHRGPVTFKTLVYDTNVGDISPLSAYFNPDSSSSSGASGHSTPEPSGSKTSSMSTLANEGPIKGNSKPCTLPTSSMNSALRSVWSETKESKPW